MRDRRLSLTILAAFIFGLSPALVANDGACMVETPLDSGQAVESARYRVSFRTWPEKIVIGEHFAVELRVCPRGNAPRPDHVRVDAQMPEHRHGMNYQATVTPQGEGRYRAEGMLFHMPGRWVFVFDVRAAGQTDRLTRSFALE
ncbi:MAG: FixH family protein [Candidatus Rokuibacteriota bacterium]